MRRALTVSLLFLSGCPSPTPGDDAGTDAGPQSPQVSSIDPDHGPVDGGTVVTINGSSFVEGASVVFGTTASQAVAFVSSRRLTAVTPAAPEGRASVTVINPDGRQGTLPAAFLFEGSSVGTI